MGPFELARPKSVPEAARALSGDAAFLAGGHTLIPAMKSRLRSVETLIDLSLLPGLAEIRRDGDTLVVGAMARHAAVAASPVVLAAIPGLACLAAGIGDPQVRNRGTIGGSVANNDPAADYPAALLALGAAIETSDGVHAADDPLALAQRIGVENAGESFLLIGAPPLVDLVEDRRLWDPAVDGQAEGAFADEDVASERLEGP